MLKRAICKINEKAGLILERLIPTYRPLGMHPEDRPANIIQFREELLANAPIVINGQVTNGWQFAFWRNRVLLALIAALLILAIILTFTPSTFSSQNEVARPNPISEFNP